MAKKYELIINQLMQEIENAIESGKKTLPPEYDLCKKYMISRQTLRKAADHLINEGLLYRIKGSGCFLTDKAMLLHKRTVALLIANDNEYTNPMFINYLYNSFKTFGIVLNVYTTDSSYETERNILNEIYSMDYSAIIIQPIKSALPNPNVIYIERIQQKGTPLFFIENPYPNILAEFCFYKDSKSAAIDIIRNLVQSEIAEIGTLLKMDDMTGHDILSGIINVSETYSLNLPDQNMLWYTEADITRLHKKTDTGFISSLLEHISDTCSCIICQNDEIAYWLGKTLIEQNRDSKISILSFDKTYLSDFGNIRFKSMQFDYQEYCNQIANAIYRVVNNNPVIITISQWSTED